MILEAVASPLWTLSGSSQLPYRVLRIGFVLGAGTGRVVRIRGFGVGQVLSGGSDRCFLGCLFRSRPGCRPDEEISSGYLYIDGSGEGGCCKRIK